jgi:hypothetical protein
MKRAAYVFRQTCNCTPKYFVDIMETYDACEGKNKKCMNNFLTQIGDKRTVVDNGEVKVNDVKP